MKKLLFESLILSRKPFKVNPFIGLLFALLLFPVLNAFGQETKSQLTTRFDVIRNETAVGGNTKTRIANAYQELADGTLSVFPIEADATSSNTYAGPSIGLDGYTGRMAFVVFDANNTGSATLNLNSIGATQIRKYESGWVILEADDIIAGKLYRLYNDGTYWQIDLGGSGGSGSGSGTTMNNLPPEYHVNDYSLVPGDTSRLLVLKDALTTLTIGNFATGVDGSQFVIYNETGATVTIDPSTYITKGPLEILDTTYAYIHFAADTFRISTATEAAGGGGTWGSITGTLSSQTDLQSALDAKVATTRTISTTSPLSGGGDLSANRTLTIADAAADATTKGAATFTAADFNSSSGNISIDYTNGQAASGSNKGFLTSADWTTFNNKMTVPSITDGSVLFWNTTISQDNTNFFFDDSNNRLGIGTNTPVTTLDVNSEDAGNNSVSTGVKITHYTSGTPAAGIGARLDFESETASANYEIGSRIESVTTDVTSTSEDFDLVFKNMAGGSTASEQLRLTSDGRLYGKSLHNNIGAVTGTSNQYVASGTYTPTLTNTTNVAASTAYVCQWIRVGNVVTVSGKFSLDATSAAATELNISLPIASSLTDEEQVGGTAASNVATTVPGRIMADATNDRAAVRFTAVSLSNDGYSFSFTYLIL